MSNLAVRAQGLGKRYRLGQAKGLNAGRRVAGSDEFWALKDVSFEIAHGEVVGIIGGNGAGKSTLLKILSRITEPTAGCADVHGRVGSLLEVGTGFHPDLTGRENIYLNGAILGMKRTEIRRKFDEIVAFAEVEKFIDTPVKRYSSGMYVRLAFAVAANLQPEILIVDEVLAVGDAAFQKKCLGKMGEAAGSGRTVLFVSHNMGTIHQLCSRVFLLRAGNLSNQGTPETVIADYLTGTLQSDDGDFDFSQHPSRAMNYQPIIQRVALRAADGSPTTQYYPDSSLRIELTLNPPQPIRHPRIAISIEDGLGRRITTLVSHFGDYQLPDIEGCCRVSCTVPRLCLGSGHYLVSVSIGAQYIGLLDSVDGGAWFDVSWRNNYGNGEPYNPVYGPVLVSSVWARVD